MTPEPEDNLRDSNQLTPSSEKSLDQVLDQYLMADGLDREAVVAELLAAFPDRRAEIESLLTSFEREEVGTASDALPPLPQQVDLESVAASDDETDREPLWAKHSGDGIAPLNETVNARTRAGEATDALPRKLGSYELLELIDSGGMGIVYKARSLAALQRLVAVKVIKPEMGGREILARFALECQSLALMSHPSIATVYEGGATEFGEPYLAMELVEGVSLTQFCNQHAINMRDRLELFRKVCAGIEHAHQKGVIHRDLKPSNILVTKVDDVPVPKVIDFGLAKLSSAEEDCDVTQHSSHTQLGQILGTLQYMSPEGATLRPATVDTRSDVFSLGVVLFEILTRTTPLAERLSSDLPIDERLRLVRSQEPMRPSDRAAAKEQQQLRGDLDAICMKALAQDPANRYPTVEALSADIENYLQGRPVTATAASGVYLLRKFARRYRTSLTIVVAVAALLMIATGVSVRWAIRATNAEQELTTQLQIAVDAQKAESAALQRAESERETAQAISDFLRLDLLAQASPLAGVGRDLTLREVLDLAAASLGDRFDARPRVKGELLATIASVYYDLGEFSTAQPYWVEAHQLLREYGGDDGYRAMIVNHALAENCYALGLDREAEARLEDNLRYIIDSENAWPDKLYVTRLSLSLVMKRLGKDSEAKAMQAALLAEADAAGESTLALRNNLAMDLVGQRRYAEALPIMQEVFEAKLAESGTDDSNTMKFQSNLAGCLIRCNEFEKALALLDDLADRRSRMLGSTHISVLVDRQYRADCLLHQGRPDEAVAAMRSLIADCKLEQLDLSSRMIANDQQLADGLFALDQDEAAIQVLSEFVDRYLEHYGNKSEVARQALARASHSLNGHGKFSESRELLDKYWVFQNGDFDNSISLADMLIADRWLKAVRGMKDWETLDRATSTLLKCIPDASDNWKAERARVQYMAGFAQRAMDQFELAANSYLESYIAQLALFGELHPETLDSQLYVGITFKESERWDEAEDVLRAMIQTSADSYPLDTGRGMRALVELNEIADHYRENDDHTAAEALYEFLVSYCASKLGPAHPATLANVNGLGLALRGQESEEKLSGADAVFRDAVSRAGTPTKVNRTKFLPLLYNWGLTLEDLGRRAEAADCFLKCAHETRLRYGADYYRAEKADVKAAECVAESGNLPRAIEIIEPLCTLDAETPAKNIPIRLEAMDLILDWAEGDQLGAAAILLQRAFEESENLSVDAWNRSRIALAAAGALRRCSDEPEKHKVALELNRAAVKLRVSEDPEDYRTANAYRSLGVAYEAVGDVASAESAYLKAIETYDLKPSKSSARQRIVNSAVQRLVDYYTRIGNTQLAQQWEERILVADE